VGASERVRFGGESFGRFQVEKEFFLEKVLGNYSGVAKPIRVYLDSGTSDYTGGDDGLKQTEAVARELERIGGSAEPT
jgi:hypothetical protein